MKLSRPKLRTAIRLVLAVTILAVIAALAAKPAGSALGHWLILEKSDFTHVDAIVVLGGDNPARPLGGVDLFRQKNAPRVVLVRERRSASLEDLDSMGVHVPGDCELRRQVLEKHGVPPEAIEVVPADADSTWEEAVGFANYAGLRGFKSAVVVTSKYHSRRSYLNFARACEPRGVQIYMVPSKYCRFDPSGWWRQRTQLKLVYVEVANLTAYYLGFR